MDIQKPFRRYVALQLEGRTLNVDIRYEKLPLTCFLCGMMDYVENQCEKYQGRQDDDFAESYGRWFQDDVLGKDYRKHVGKRFGLGPEGGWSMSVLLVEDMDESMQECEGPEEVSGGHKQISGPLKLQDLGKGLMEEGGLVLCSLPMVEGRQLR